MADKYIRLNAGRLKEKEATVTSAGAGDAGEIVALDASGKLDTSVMPVGVGPQTATIQASEALSAGNLVNVWDDSGTVKVRKADATTTGKEADGFVLAGVSSGANATVYFNGTITGLSSLTRGGYYLLSTTPGGVVLASSAPSGSGNMIQPVGRAISTTELAFNPLDAVELA